MWNMPVDICHHNLWAVTIDVVALGFVHFILKSSIASARSATEPNERLKEILIGRLPREQFELSYGSLAGREIGNHIFFSLFDCLLNAI